MNGFKDIDQAVAYVGFLLYVHRRFNEFKDDGVTAYGVAFNCSTHMKDAQSFAGALALNGVDVVGVLKSHEFEAAYEEEAGS